MRDMTICGWGGERREGELEGRKTEIATEELTGDERRSWLVKRRSSSDEMFPGEA